MKEPQPRVQWQSVRWPDKSTYEGLVKDDKCHVRGVFKYSNGDRYEGEFEDNNMSGYGVYVWGQEGSVYREEGHFVNDEWMGDVMGCTIEQARAAAAQADTAAQMARVFEHGHGGADEATTRAQEAAAAAVAAAQHQPKRQQQRQQSAAEAPYASGRGAMERPAVPSGAAFASNEGGQLSVVVRKAALSMQQALAGSSRAAYHAQQAAQGAVQAAHRAVQQLLSAGQRKVQQSVSSSGPSTPCK